MREIRPSGSVRGVRRKPYPYRDVLLPLRSSAGASRGVDGAALWRRYGTKGAGSNLASPESTSASGCVRDRRLFTHGLQLPTKSNRR
jgi:hypothetical protein